MCFNISAVNTAWLHLGEAPRIFKLMVSERTLVNDRDLGPRGRQCWMAPEIRFRKVKNPRDGRWRGLQGSDVTQCPGAVALSMVTIARFILCVVHHQKKHLKKEKSRINIMLQGLSRTFWNFHAKCLPIHPLSFTTSWPKPLHDLSLQSTRGQALGPSAGENPHRLSWHQTCVQATGAGSWAERRQHGGLFPAEASLMFSVQPHDLCWLQWTVYLWTHFRSRCSVLPCGRRRQCSETSEP